MKWYNAHKDLLPAHEQQVLISVNGVYYITTYDCKNQAFRLLMQPENYFGLTDEATLYWAEFRNEPQLDLLHKP